jgi:hypothetical protein
MPRSPTSARGRRPLLPSELAAAGEDGSMDLGRLVGPSLRLWDYAYRLLWSKIAALILVDGGESEGEGRAADRFGAPGKASLALACLMDEVAGDPLGLGRPDARGARELASWLDEKPSAADLALIAALLDEPAPFGPALFTGEGGGLRTRLRAYARRSPLLAAGGACAGLAAELDGEEEEAALARDAKLVAGAVAPGRPGILLGPLVSSQVYALPRRLRGAWFSALSGVEGLRLSPWAA